MRYDPTNDAVLRPHLGAAIDPALIGSNMDGLCAELSRLAYVPYPPNGPRLPQDLARLGLTGAAFFDDRHTNTQAFAALDASNTAFVVFRGTESDKPQDLVTDGMILQKSWDRGGKVHRGFAKAYDSGQPVAVHDAGGQPIAELDQRHMGMRAALTAWLTAQSWQRLVASGHSLGAALATLFASDHPEAELITFGSPRVGNAEFATLFDPPARIVHRHRDCSDIVTRVPPERITDYKHTKGLIYYDEAGKHEDPAPGTVAMLAEAAGAAISYLARYQPNLSNAPVRELADHAPINYISAVLGLREPG
jgi:triacylglycerol lipase